MSGPPTRGAFTPPQQSVPTTNPTDLYNAARVNQNALAAYKLKKRLEFLQGGPIDDARAQQLAKALKGG